MDKESILRLGLGYIKNIDAYTSDESYDPTNNNHIITIRLNKGEFITCPYCGLVNHNTIRSMVTQKMNHASGLEDKITLNIKRRVYICECGHTFKEENPFTETKRKNTLQKEYKILEALKDINKSIKDVALEFNVSNTTITNIFDAKVDIKPQQLTTVICVDEIYSKHCGFHKYCFIIYSPQLDKVLDVLPSRNKEDLIGYFSKIPLDQRKRVKYWSMDLYEVYRQVAKACFPNILISADHFHVIKNLTDFFNSARKRIMNKYSSIKKENDSYYWIYKKYWKLLLKNPEKLSFEKIRINRSGMYLDEHQIVDYMLKLDNDLRSGYELLVEYKNFNSVATTENAAEMLDDLILKYHNSPIPEYEKGYKLLRNWRQEIINSFNKVNGHTISNGGMERANRDIKTIIRHAYGYKNFTRLRNRIMYIKNDDASILGYRKETKK